VELTPSATRSGLFAFQNKEKSPFESDDKGWSLYQVEPEFQRLQLRSDQWRITDFNASYTLARFPDRFIVPTSFSDG